LFLSRLHLLRAAYLNKTYNEMDFDAWSIWIIRDKLFMNIQPLFVITFLFATTTSLTSASKSLALPDLPVAAQKMIKSQLGSAELVKIDPSTEAGRTVYEITINQNGSARGFIVDVNGKLLRCEIATSEVPEPVKKVINSHAGNSKIGRVDKVFGNDEDITYEAELIKRGQHHTLTVAGDARWFSLEIPLVEAPRAVQKTIRETVGNGKIETIARTTEDGEETYEVEFTKDAAELSLTVDSNGKLLEIEVPLDETPAVVRKTIQQLATEGKIGDITKIFEEDRIVFNVEVVKAGTTRDYSIDASGKLVSAQITLADVPEVMQKAIKDKLGTARLTHIERTIEPDGKVVYQVEGWRDKKRVEFTVPADGAVSPR
jgi:uncharacterized membrane protein YkoI